MMKELSTEEMASLRGGFFLGGNSYSDSFNKITSKDNYSETNQLGLSLHSRYTDQYNEAQSAVGNVHVSL